MIELTESLLDRYAAGQLSRRDAAKAILGMALVSLTTGNQVFAEAAGEPAFQASGLNHLGIRVSDVARSRDFYCQHLGMSVIRDNSPGNCFLRSGEHYFGLFRSTTPAVDHFCFVVDAFDAGQAVETLEEAGLSPRRQEDRVYFDDPDGLEIQIDSPYGSWPGPPPTAR